MINRPLALLHDAGVSPDGFAARLTEAGFEAETAELAQWSAGAMPAAPWSALFLLARDGNEAAAYEELARRLSGVERPPVILIAETPAGAAREAFFNDGFSDIWSPAMGARELASRTRLLMAFGAARETALLHQAAVDEANRMLEKALALKNHFISRVTHDLRTPLTTMKLCSELLEGAPGEPGNAPQKIADILAVLMRGIQRVETVFRELSTISRLDIEDVRLQCRLVDLNLSATESVAECFPEAMQQDVTLDVQTSDIAPIWADAGRIRQLIANMIANALIRSEPGGRILLRTEQEPGAAIIRVEDGGSRIPEPMLQKIMAGLASDDPSAETRVELYVVNRLALAHGGEMRFTASTDGMALTVRLPLDPERTGTKENLHGDE